MINILLLEDDEILSESLKFLLEGCGYNVTTANNGNEALEETYETKFDLYLFDVNVAYINGFDLLRELRVAGDLTPAFFITAMVDLDSVYNGFDSGADEYIKKPFEPEELLIRIEAFLKKRSLNIKIGDVSYDSMTSTIKKNDKTIDLAYVEHKVFELLVKNIDKVVTKHEFFEQMEKPTDAGLRVHINRLKKTLDLNIINIRGVGYRLEKI
jgi:DNA-binding response OmpR family regulator